MSKNQKIFHESWYLIANQRLSLRSNVEITRQFMRGVEWHVLHDSFSNQYYRLRKNVYEFVARLSTKKTVEEVWHELLEQAPDKAPGQGEIIDLLAQLYHANLLHYDLAPNSVKLFERYKKRRQSLVKQNLLNIMFARVPIFDPDPILKRLMPLIRLVIGRAGAIAWIVMVCIGIKTAIENFSALKLQSEGVLAPSNLLLLYVGVALIKGIHEMGHAFAVRRFGGEVHAIGIMLMVLTPLPYTDATASWFFRNKWHRIFVGAAGMIFELFVAAIAIVVWALTGEGVIHALAYNMVFSASVTTLLFNINPLLRYDGYYMLCDLLGMPNLQQNGVRQVTYVTERYAFGKKDATPAASGGEGWFLFVYAIASFIYRVLVFSGIMLYISTKLLLVAVIMGISMAASWTVVPLYKFVKYLSTNPGLARVRGRAIRLSLATGAVVFALLNYVPFPYGFTAPGILKAVGHIMVVNLTAGRVTALGKKTGTPVQPDDTLLILENPELTNRRAETAAAVSEAKTLYYKALQQSQADIEPLEKRIAAYSARLSDLDRQVANLTVRAEIAGIWVSPDIDDYLGRTLPRGSHLGQIVDERSFYFASVVSQQEISELFSQKARWARIRLRGKAETILPVKEYMAIPMEQRQLPSAALGFLGGGDIAVDQTDSAGTRTAEPFYEVRASIGVPAKALLRHGRTGKIKFAIGYKPLLWQGWRKIRQLLQKHYRI